jgi:GNAT superfamily N-acetyltransferase
VPEIMRLVSEFYAASPYSSMSLSPKKVRQIAEGVISGRKEENCIILALDSEGQPRGILGAAVLYPLHTEELVASELFLWVEPEYRKDGMGRWLVKALEEWAKRVGCTHVQIAKINDTPKDKFGYVQAETSYIRKL